jgi:hypothetical protein
MSIYWLRFIWYDSIVIHEAGTYRWVYLFNTIVYYLSTFCNCDGFILVQDFHTSPSSFLRTRSFVFMIVYYWLTFDLFDTDRFLVLIDRCTCWWDDRQITFIDLFYTWFNMTKIWLSIEQHLPLTLFVLPTIELLEVTECALEISWCSGVLSADRTWQLQPEQCWPMIFSFNIRLMLFKRLHFRRSLLSCFLRARICSYIIPFVRANNSSIRFRALESMVSDSNMNNKRTCSNVVLMRICYHTWRW